MKKLCLAIPTHNRVEDVKNKLEHEIALFAECDIDVHIFDSSTNEDTEKLVGSFRDAGYGNLFFHQYSDGPSSNEKVYRIFEWASGTDYEYIWMIHDHTICNEDAVEYLMRALDQKADFLLLNMQAGGYGIKRFENLDHFLLEGAWRLNSFGASVVRNKTFLTGIDWEKMRRIYGGSKTLNYSHIGLYFERAAKLQTPYIMQVYFDRKDFLDFNRGKKIQWEADTLRICLECWGEVISRLPQSYHCKLETLRSQDRWFLSKYSLLGYRKKGFYDFGKFMRYRKWLQIIYPEDLHRDFWISVLPYRIGMRCFCGKLIKSMRRARKNGDQIYIFGAGRHAIECAVFLQEINEDFDGFVVSDRSGNPDELLGHEVWEAKKVLPGKNSFVLLAILTSGVEGVKKTLREMSGKDTRIEMLEMS